MTQDSDVARMAAALRTPSLRYRSFGNTPVRHAALREQVPVPDAFPLLDEALAAIDSLPPDVPPMPPTPEAIAAVEPVPIPPRSAMAPPMSASAPPPAVTAPPSLVPAPPAPAGTAPTLPAPRPVASPPRPVAPVPGAGGTPSLLQTLLAEAPSRPSRPPRAPIVVGRHPPQAPVPPPRSAVVESYLPAAPPMPAASVTAPMPSPDSRGAGERSSGRQASSGTGSSLLDTLVERDDAAQSAAHYPLLDALTAAMRSDPSGASSRVWPAARVEMALPELLRRIAAGVRSGRSLV